MGAYAVSYIAFAVFFLAVDMVWLLLIARGFYREQLGSLMADTINAPAAVAFYVLYALGAMVFVIVPALESGGVTRAFLMGVLLGLVAYGTYDLTNLATVKGWPAQLAIVDMLWGAALTGAASAFAVFVGRNV